ncbi:hypothetical protein PIB30_073071 [Stylosanthes scabra]|uniref:Protein FAR1-RELATED SEQUENCE n=1 Tax=Stylosanthes scabra TaxID=79078 RepID=A0ABU6RPF8_9FABA|nr:hypothetical protein [Stylosanthes scabra]
MWVPDYFQDEFCAGMRSTQRSEMNKVPKCYISSCWSKNIKRKHTYIKTSHEVKHFDESKNIFRGLRSHFFNVTQEFVSDIEEASILHSSMDDSLIKLYDYRASKLQSSVPSRQNSNASESQCAINVDLLLAPLQVSTKGRPSNRRLDAELDKSIRNATRRRKKDSTSVDFLVNL